MRENLNTGSVPILKAFLQTIIDVVEVDDHQIRIKGSRDVLERAVLAGQADGETGSQMSTRWRAKQDSNLHCALSERAASCRLGYWRNKKSGARTMGLNLGPSAYKAG